MRLIYLADEREENEFTDGDGYTVTSVRHNIGNEFPNLQALVEKIAAEHEFDGIVLSAKLGKEDGHPGLELAMRIRLSFATIKEKAFASLFIYCPELPELLYRQQVRLREQPTATILLAEGTLVFDSNGGFKALAAKKEHYNVLNADNLEEHCLNILRVRRPDAMGNHSLANLMGVIRLAAITGYRKVLDNNAYVQHHRSDLYMMYKMGFKSAADVAEPERGITGGNKKVLLIDDKENYGWKDVLEKIFPAGVLKVVENGPDFIDRAKHEVRPKDAGGTDWDLILLDLRLEDREDVGQQVNATAASFSGAGLLADIKNANRGTQVIIFTASNKAWILRELINAPYYADGYFIKESPDVIFDESFSRKSYTSFVQQVKDCFWRKPLKELVGKMAFINAGLRAALPVAGLTTGQQNEIDEFVGSVRFKMQTALEIVSNAKEREPIKLRMAFLQLYQTLEDYTKLSSIYNRVGVTDSVMRKDGTAADVIYPAAYGDGYTASIKFNRARFTFQNAMVDYKPVKTVSYTEEPFLDENPGTLFRMVCIFRERHNFVPTQCNTLILFTYLRSHLCGHVTGDIDTDKRDIMLTDLIDLACILEKIIVSG